MGGPLRVAVAGAGVLGSVHARVLAKMDGVALAGICDTDAERARALAKSWKTRVLASLDEIPVAADACVVAVPTSAHVGVAERLLAAGVACLVEKPLAPTPEEGRRIVAAARRSGAPLMVGHVERFNPAVIALRAQNLRPRFIEAQRVSPFAFRSTDIGVVMDLMIHDLDLILHLVDAPLEDVHAVGVAVVGEHEDLANARLLFADGAVANVTASRVALKTERKLRLFARDCYVTLDFKEKSGRIVRPAPRLREALASGALAEGRLNPLEVMLKKLVTTSTLDVRPDLEPLAEEDREFVAAIRERRDPLVTGEDAVRALDAAARVVASLRRNLARAGAPGPQ